MSKYPVAEKFVSINGEGARAGELAVFVRFKGCNLHCSYCDTRWACVEDAPFEEMTAEEITAYCKGITNVTLTGGEPMLQELAPLCDMLIENGHNVEIETNGSISIKELSQSVNRPCFTLDYKSPSSGMESKMLKENYKYLEKEDTVKFVVGDDKDLAAAVSVIDEYDLTALCHVYLSPIFGKIDPAHIVDHMKENDLNGVRLQLQLHKFIWDPEKRGV